MALYGYTNDFTIDNLLNVGNLSHTHKQTLTPRERQIQRTLTQFYITNPTIDWQTVNLKKIYNILQRDQKHKPSIMQNIHYYKSPDKWSEVFQMLKFRPTILNHYRETNFRILHHAIATNYYYAHKLHIHTNDKCRICKNKPETLEHILLECHRRVLRHIEDITDTNFEPNEIMLQTPTENIVLFMVQSIYRNATIFYHRKHMRRQLNIEDTIIHSININIRKYRELFKPP